MPQNTLILLVSSAFLAAAGQLLFRFGAQGRDQLIEFINVWVSLGLLCYGLGLAIWLFILSKQDISQVYSFTALTFVLVMLGGVFLLNEQPTLSTLVGSGIVLIGLLVMVFQPS